MKKRFPRSRSSDVIHATVMGSLGNTGMRRHSAVAPMSTLTSIPSEAKALHAQSHAQSHALSHTVMSDEGNSDMKDDTGTSTLQHTTQTQGSSLRKTGTGAGATDNALANAHHTHTHAKRERSNTASDGESVAGATGDRAAGGGTNTGPSAEASTSASTAAEFPPVVTQHHTGLTCMSCRLAKVKCDKMSPCGRCLRLRLECTQQTRKRGRRSSGTAGGGVGIPEVLAGLEDGTTRDGAKHGHNTRRREVRYDPNTHAPTHKTQGGGQDIEQEPLGRYGISHARPGPRKSAQQRRSQNRNTHTHAQSSTASHHLSTTYTPSQTDVAMDGTATAHARHSTGLDSRTRGALEDAVTAHVCFNAQSTNPVQAQTILRHFVSVSEGFERLDSVNVWTHCGAMLGISATSLLTPQLRERLQKFTKSMLKPLDRPRWGLIAPQQVAVCVPPFIAETYREFGSEACVQHVIRTHPSAETHTHTVGFRVNGAFATTFVPCEAMMREFMRAQSSPAALCGIVDICDALEFINALTSSLFHCSEVPRESLRAYCQHPMQSDHSVTAGTLKMAVRCTSPVSMYSFIGLAEVRMCMCSQSNGSVEMCFGMVVTPLPSSKYIVRMQPGSHRSASIVTSEAATTFPQVSPSHADSAHTQGHVAMAGSGMSMNGGARGMPVNPMNSLNSASLGKKAKFGDSPPLVGLRGQSVPMQQSLPPRMSDAHSSAVSAMSMAVQPERASFPAVAGGSMSIPGIGDRPSFGSSSVDAEDATMMGDAPLGMKTSLGASLAGQDAGVGGVFDDASQSDESLMKALDFCLEKGDFMDQSVPEDLDLMGDVGEM